MNWSALPLNRKRAILIAVSAIGVVIPWIRFLRQLRFLSLLYLLLTALVTLAIFEVMRRNAASLRRDRLLLYVLGAILFRHVVDRVFDLLNFAVRRIPFVAGDLQYWVPHINFSFGVLFYYGTTLAVVLLSFYFLRDEIAQPPARRRKRSPARSLGTTPRTAQAIFDGFTIQGGPQMDIRRSEPTRLLAASAVLDPVARKRILDQINDRVRGLAPELGMDLRLPVQVARFTDRREKRYSLLLAGTFAAGLTTFGLFAIILAIAFGPVGVACLPALAVWVLLSAGVAAFKRRQETTKLLPLFERDVYEPETVAENFPAPTSAEVDNAITIPDQNVVVYRSFTPFVGAGTALGGWSFAINLTRPKEEMGSLLKPVPFEIAALYDALDRAMQQLDFDGLDVQDCLFVSGLDVKEFEDLLPDPYERPLVCVDSGIMRRYVGANDSLVRHYKWIRIYDWGNELVLSHFLRFARSGTNLFVEFNRYLLTPLQSKFRKIDGDSKNGTTDLIGLLIGSLVSGPMSSIGALGNLSFGDKEQVIKNLKRNRKSQIDDSQLFNYGINVSLREVAASNRFLHYFQMLDRDMYVKIVEREILDAIVNFLDDHNINTSEIRERQTTIMNSGLIVNAGDIDADNIAIGSGAQATTQTTARQSGTSN